MPTITLETDEAFEADLRALGGDPAQVIREAVRERARREAIEELTGLWKDGPPLPRREDGTVDWGAWKDELWGATPE